MMVKKEYNELLSSYKILFVPIIFTILMITQPITMNMLPDILANTTDFPEGTVLHIPPPTAVEALTGSMGQLEALGMFVLVMVVMGTIAGERASGVLSMVMVKPVSRANYYYSKMVAAASLAIVSLFVSVASTAYYVDSVIGQLNWWNVVLATLLYVPNLLLIVTVTVGASGLLKNSVAAGGVSVVVNLILFTVPQFFEQTLDRFSPNALTSASVHMLKNGHLSAEAVTSLFGVSLMVLICLFLGVIFFRKQEF